MSECNEKQRKNTLWPNFQKRIFLTNSSGITTRGPRAQSRRRARLSGSSWRAWSMHNSLARGSCFYLYVAKLRSRPLGKSMRTERFSFWMHSKKSLVVSQNDFYCKRINFVGEKFRTFPLKTFRMEFNFVLSEWLKKVKTRRDDRKACKPGGTNLGMEFSFVLVSNVRKLRN